MQSTAMTLKKISRLSGYSVSTVSKALNDKEDISTETRATILTIAKEHHYVPNYYALALRKRQPKTLAVIIPHISETFYGDLLSEIQNMTFDLGYRLLVFQSFGCKEKEEECFNIINDGSVNGALIVTPLNNSSLVESLDLSHSVPTILWKVHAQRIDVSTELEKTKMYFNELLYKIF